MEQEIDKSTESSTGPQSEAEPIKRKRGGQLGNKNALKYGLYIHHRHLRNTTPIEKSMLYDLTDHIKELKKYLHRLFELGTKSDSLEFVNETLRVLSVGCFALARLITLHDANSAIPLENDLLGVDYYDPNYQPENYKDPSFEEIEKKLKELGA